MKTADFAYTLPPELIAQHPAARRDESRLLVYRRDTQAIEHRHFHDLPEYLSPADGLVLNETRVLPARLLGHKQDTGGTMEFLLLNRLNDTDWHVLVQPGRRALEGARFVFGSMQAEVLSRTDDGGRVVRFFYDGVFEEVLEQLGRMPLPPYIREALEEPERYQTIYAKTPGSAAAPTAGLHFTDGLLRQIGDMGVDVVKVLLHVGLGTFRPVKAGALDGHTMHAEYYEMSPHAAEQVNAIHAKGGRVVAVGTTSVRTLETVARQHMPLQAASGWTDIFIYPGYAFQCVDALITNFHLPESTLLMLVSAFMGREEALRCYEVAVTEQYRFYSFGDAMLIL